MIIVALRGILWTPAHPRAQQAPSAVIADGPTDKKFPPGLPQFIVPKHRVELDAWLYAASGPGPHGTGILPHGHPGDDMSGNLAQCTRRAGCNVVLFHYRRTSG